MPVKPEDVARVAAFRNRLVAFVNYLETHRPGYGEDYKPAARAHLGTEISALAQDYGRIYKVIVPYGIAQMRQFGGIVSQDVVRDTISVLDHPEYQALAKMAISHLDQTIGHLRAEVEDQPARAVASADALYRYTSPVFWLGRLAALVRWIVTTNAGRIVGLITLLVTAVVGGIASGIAQAWWEQLVR